MAAFYNNDDDDDEGFNIIYYVYSSTPIQPPLTEDFLQVLGYLLIECILFVVVHTFICESVIFHFVFMMTKKFYI